MRGRLSALLPELKQHKFTYLFLLPTVIYYVIFSYVPMYGITIAFKDYQLKKGILGSPWVGFEKFEMLFRDSDFWHAVRNTVEISSMSILITFPIPVLLAVLFNELRDGKFRKGLQTVYTFPHFLSWIIVANLMINFLGSSGVVNSLLEMIGAHTVDFLSTPSLFRPLLYATGMWKEAGWGCIVYIAAIASINPELYEAAMVDGANRFQRMVYITWAGIRSMVVVFFLYAIGGIMNASFDQIFNLYNPVVKPVAEVIDTYIYNITFNSTMFDFGYSTAVGLFKSVINFLLLIAADRFAKLSGERGIF